jgi:DNA polymerase-3 subunit beta
LLDPGDVRDALRRVLLVAEGKTRIIRLERAANKITLSSLSPEHGEATEEIPAEVDAAGFGVVGFNAAYLASALEHLGGDTLRIDQDTPGSPGLFRRQPADKARVVIMPCRA